MSRPPSRPLGTPLPRRQRTALVLGLVVALLLALVTTAPTLEHRWQLAHRLWPDLMGPVDPSAPLGYSVMDHQSSDPSRPVTYDPCIVLHVVVNHREAPPQADRTRRGLTLMGSGRCRAGTRAARWDPGPAT